MSKRKTFSIPSLFDMDKGSDETIAPKMLFNQHRNSQKQKQAVTNSSSDVTSSTIETTKHTGYSPAHLTAPMSMDNNSGTSSPSRILAGDTCSSPNISTSGPNKIHKNVVGPSGEQGGIVIGHPGEKSDDLAAVEKPGLSHLSSNALIVSTRQRGNPLLKHIRNVPWEFGDIISDYQVSPTGCVLYLSLRYHALNPNYIHERLKQLGHSYDLRVLLVQVDVKDPHHSLKELAKICMLADTTLLLVWSAEEAARYLETYKSFENKPPDLIMEKTETNFLGRVTDTFTTVKKVNKTDAMTVLSTFGTVQGVVEASEEDLGLCPGFGPQKAKRLHDVFHEPFLKAKRSKTVTAASGKPDSVSPAT